jgi:hypothetical protein
MLPPQKQQQIRSTPACGNDRKKSKSTFVLITALA